MNHLIFRNCRKPLTRLLALLAIGISSLGTSTEALAQGECKSKPRLHELEAQRERVYAALSTMETLHHEYAATLAFSNLAVATAAASAALPVTYMSLGLAPEAVGYFAQLAATGSTSGIIWGAVATNGASAVDSFTWDWITENLARQLNQPVSAGVRGIREPTEEFIQNYFVRFREGIRRSRDQLLITRPRDEGFFDVQVEKYRDQEIRLVAARALLRSVESEMELLKQASAGCVAQQMH